MKLRSAWILALAASLLVSACGTERNPLGPAALGALKSIFQGNRQAPLTTEVLRARLTPELRAQIGVPVMITELPKQKVAAVVIYNTQNAGVTTWLATDGVGLYTRGGLVTGTRGVGFDLMSADVAGPLAVITGSGTGTASRVHRYLDGENQEITVRFTCHYTGGNRQVDERCDSTNDDFGTGTALTIHNRYWLSRDRAIWKSEQWIGSRNGTMLLESP